MEQTITQKNIH